MHALASAAFTARPPRRPIWEREAAPRDSDANRLPDHAAFWARLPLPFSPAEAWKLLPPEAQAEIGAAVIGMHLAQYVHGDGRADADQFHEPLSPADRGIPTDYEDAMPYAITAELLALSDSSAATGA